MTESEWLVCMDLDAMLECLREKAGNRKLRLFAAACCRRIWGLMQDDRSRHAVEIAEQWSDGKATDEERREAAAFAHQAHSDMWAIPHRDSEQLARLNARDAAAWICKDAPYAEITGPGITDCTVTVALSAASAAGIATTPEAGPRQHARCSAILIESIAQVVLLRDTFGPLAFRPLPTIDPELFAWNGGLVRRLAEAAYEERSLPAGTLDPARLAVLADALEEAGCTDAELLAHFRSPGPHYRGCWALDVVLGKE
jgi:hypothetical protein